MSERFSLKDHLFNKKSVRYLADLFYHHDSSFPKEDFIKNICSDFPALELKERITRIRYELERVLPEKYPEALMIILRALPPQLNPNKTDDDFGEFILAPLAEYIQVHGCNKKYLSQSLHALRECTQRFSAEFSLRHFINAFPEESFDFLLQGARSDNYHVRRLSSESLRPKLPWAIGIDIDYKKPIEILDILFCDSARYVTRSVANHMNDISKINTDMVITTLKKWQASGKQNELEMQYITKHSLRTLLKKGHPGALALLGYNINPAISITNFQLNKNQVFIGEALEFSFRLVSHANQKLLIDYELGYQNKKGDLSPKVFRIKQIHIKKGQEEVFCKKQSMKIMTTKKIYPGKHTLVVQINGKKFPVGEFTLVEGH